MTDCCLKHSACKKIVWHEHGGPENPLGTLLLNMKMPECLIHPHLSLSNGSVVGVPNYRRTDVTDFIYLTADAGWNDDFTHLIDTPHQVD